MTVENGDSERTPSYLYNPGPSASDNLRKFLSAFAPFFSSTTSDAITVRDAEDVESFAAAELGRAHGPVEGGRLAGAYRPAVKRTATKVSAISSKGDGSSDGVITSRYLAAKLCAYAGMYDSFVMFDGGISDSFAEADGDASIQLSEWIYGYRIAMQGGSFTGLKVRNEKQARAVFEEMKGENGEVNYDEWCDYLEEREMVGRTRMSMLFDGRAAKEERARLAGLGSRLAEEEKLAEEAEKARLAEEDRPVEEANLVEENRLAEEAGKTGLSREDKLAEEERGLAEDAEKAHNTEDDRFLEEARLAEENRIAERSLAEEARMAEEEKLTEEAKKSRIEEETRRAEADQNSTDAATSAKAESAEKEERKTRDQAQSAFSNAQRPMKRSRRFKKLMAPFGHCMGSFRRKVVKLHPKN